MKLLALPALLLLSIGGKQQSPTMPVSEFVSQMSRYLVDNPDANARTMHILVKRADGVILADVDLGNIEFPPDSGLCVLRAVVPLEGMP